MGDEKRRIADRLPAHFDRLFVGHPGHCDAVKRVWTTWQAIRAIFRNVLPSEEEMYVPCRCM